MQLKSSCKSKQPLLDNLDYSDSNAKSALRFTSVRQKKTKVFIKAD